MGAQKKETLIFVLHTSVVEFRNMTLLNANINDRRSKVKGQRSKVKDHYFICCIVPP